MSDTPIGKLADEYMREIQGHLLQASLKQVDRLLNLITSISDLISPLGPEDMTAEDAIVWAAKEIVRLRTSDDPEMDCTDFAHPAWCRGSESGVARIVQKLQWVLDGNDLGDGKTAHPPLNKLIGDIVAIRKAVGLLRYEVSGQEDMTHAEVIEAVSKEIDRLRSEIAQAKAEASTERKLRMESDLPAALCDADGKECPCTLCVHWRKCDAAIAARDTDALIGLVR